MKVILTILAKIDCHGNALKELEKRSRSIIYKYLSFGEKNAKIGPVDPEIIGLRVIIKKERN